MLSTLFSWHPLWATLKSCLGCLLRCVVAPSHLSFALHPQISSSPGSSFFFSSFFLYHKQHWHAALMAYGLTSHLTALLICLTLLVHSQACPWFCLLLLLTECPFLFYFQYGLCCHHLLSLHLTKIMTVQTRGCGVMFLPFSSVIAFNDLGLPHSYHHFGFTVGWAAFRSHWHWCVHCWVKCLPQYMSSSIDE